jgi:hypothetical protein
MTVRAVSNNPASPFYNASAPNLTGQAGSLTTLLDAVLVSGFSGFTALGWTIGQTTTNKRQYVMAASGTGNSLWVDDAASGTGGAKEARCSGYATMSATTPTGTGQFPTSGQSTIGTGMLVIRKSTTADATVRYWTIVGDGHTFYLWTETGDYTAPTVPFTFMFGDFFTYSSSDTSNCAIAGRQIENDNRAGPGNSATSYESMPVLNLMNGTGLSNTLNGHYLAANFTNVGGSLAFGKHSDQAKMGAASGGSGQTVGCQGNWNSSTSSTYYTNQFVYPNGPDGGLYQAPIWVHHSGFVRGYLKGLWCPLQHIPLNHNDTFSGSGNLAGKSFLALNALGLQFNGASPTTGLNGQFFVETSDTWS